MVRNLEQIRKEYIKKRKEKADKVREINNRRRTLQTFEENEVVYLRDLRIAECCGKSLMSHYRRPFVIISVDNDRQQCLLEDMKSNKRKICHMTHLKKQGHWENDTVVPAKTDVHNLLQNKNNSSKENENIDQASTSENQEQSPEVTPTRLSARIRDENYKHSTVNIRK